MKIRKSNVLVVKINLLFLYNLVIIKIAMMAFGLKQSNAMTLIKYQEMVVQIA